MDREQLELVKPERRKPPLRVAELVARGLVGPKPERVATQATKPRPRRRRMKQGTIFERMGVLARGEE